MSNLSVAQKNKKTNFTAQSFFGVKTGMNRTLSYTQGEKSISSHLAILGEYFFTENWSASIKIEYLNTGLSFYYPANKGGLLSSSYPESKGSFTTDLIGIPINIKREMRLSNEFYLYFEGGPFLAIETNGVYDYTKDQVRKYAKEYLSINAAVGAGYYVNKKLGFFADATFIGPSPAKGKEPQVKWFGSQNKFRTTNMLYSVGVKYSFRSNLKKNFDLKK